MLEKLAQGYRAAAIAEEFVVSLTTVRSQIRSILSKLGVNSQLEAVAMIRERLMWQGGSPLTALQRRLSPGPVHGAGEPVG